MHFYRSEEVDRPAEPESNWNLDAAAFETAGVRVLVFEVYISRLGEVVACTLVEPEAMTTEFSDALEQRVRHTSLRPAVRHGMPVASVRRIEVSVL